MKKNKKKLVIRVENLEKNYQHKTLWKSVSFTLHTKEKLVIVGGNGVGKSTLAEVLAQKKKYNDGNIEYYNNATIGYLPQDVERFSEEKGLLTVLEYYTNSFPELSEVAKNLLQCITENKNCKHA